MIWPLWRSSPLFSAPRRSRRRLQDMGDTWPHHKRLQPRAWHWDLCAGSWLCGGRCSRGCPVLTTVSLRKPLCCWKGFLLWTSDRDYLPPRHWDYPSSKMWWFPRKVRRNLLDKISLDNPTPHDGLWKKPHPSCSRNKGTLTIPVMTPDELWIPFLYLLTVNIPNSQYPNPSLLFLVSATWVQKSTGNSNQEPYHYFLHLFICDTNVLLGKLSYVIRFHLN